MKNGITKFWRTEDKATIMTSWGKLMSLFGYNDGAAVFVQLHSSATPTDETLIATIPAPAKSPFSLDVPVVGMDFPALHVHQSAEPLTYNPAPANSIGFTTVVG